MAKKTKRRRKLKKGLLKDFVKFLKNKSEKAQKATRLLVIMVLLSIITGIGAFYLYQPAKEIYVAESTFISESRSIYDYKIDSNKRKEQTTKAEEAEKVYASVMDKYTTDSNALIRSFAKIHSNFIKLLIAILIVLPYFSIGVMFIGSPVNFMFAVANIILVAPIKAIIFLFNSFREKKDNQKTSSLKIRNQE